MGEVNINNWQIEEGHGCVSLVPYEQSKNVAEKTKTKR
jgi:hypothetical protein